MKVYLYLLALPAVLSFPAQAQRNSATRNSARPAPATAVASTPAVIAEASATLGDRPFLAPPLLSLSSSSHLQQGREALTDKRYADATKYLTLAAQEKTAADEALILLGNAQLYAKNYTAAISAYDEFVQKFPDSKWRHKALFQKADALAAKQQWAQAAAIYEKELEYIVSDARREQIAATYLKYADIYYNPPKKSAAETPTPNWQRAKSLYLKALEIGLTPSRQADVILRVGLADYNAQNYNGAIQSFERVRREYPNSSAAADALFYIGLSRLKAGDMRGARRALRDFLSDYTTHDKRAEAQLAVAQSYRVPNPSNDRELELGVAALREFLEKFPTAERALEAEYWIGLSFFNRARYEDAVREFESFVARHRTADGEEVALAKYYLGFAYQRQKKFTEAIAAWEKFLADHSVHAKWNEVQRLVIDTYYAIGEEAYKNKDYDGARKAWDDFTRRYPLDVRNADIMFRLGVMLDEAGKHEEALAQWRRVVSKYAGTEAASRAQYMIALTYEKLGQWDEAFAALKLVQGKWQPEAQQHLSTLRERRLVVYTERAFTTKDTPALKVVSRNVPRVLLRAYRVDLRDYFVKENSVAGVSDLDLNLIAPDQEWIVDLEKYAQYKELDTQIPLPFKGAGVWAITCRALDEKPKDENAEKASTPTRGGLEATSVVFITDIGLVTKSTKNEVFVWAENLLTQQPVAGAQVLISDGEELVARGVTNEEGVYRFARPAQEAGDETKPGTEVPSGVANDAARTKNQKDKKPKTATAKKVAAKKNEKKPVPPAVQVLPDASGHFPEDNLRILAMKDAHFAATEGNLASVIQVASLAPTGFLYTDRPLYRPGQTVQLKGIVRQVKSGAYTFAPGAEYSLIVSTPSGATLYSQDVELNEWGTFSDTLRLPEDAQPGNYQIALSRPDEADGKIQQPLEAAGVFQVAVYQLDKIRLTIEVPKNVYLRGEEVKGKVAAKYYYGEALRNRKIRFGSNDSLGKEYTTDDKGEFEFSLATRAFDEDQGVRLWARLDDEGVTAQTGIFVATVGVNAGLDTLRQIYLSNESFDVNVVTNDLANKPFSGAWKLRALKIEKSDNNQTGEREVLARNFKTTDGKATIALKLADAGDYILRIEGQDASGNPVSSEMALQIVGEDDDVRLRLLPETDTLKSGESAAVKVLWRGHKASERNSGDTSPRLALVTYEADHIYGHQLVSLSRGENTIRVPVSTPLAPAFRLSVTLLDGDRMHQAYKWFAVERDLKVEVLALRDGKPLAKDAMFRPGDKVRLQVTTRDQNGAPVAAELSLAAIDEALWNRSGGQLPIASLWGARRATDSPVLTLASNTFNFTSQARQKVFEVRAADNFSRTMLAGAEYPDIPLDHWAYNALNKLSAAGVIEGYPNGTYSGGRALTRYEAAVAVARVLQNQNNVAANAPSTSANAEYNDAVNALANEFRTELAALGVRPAELENRVTALENRVVKPARQKFNASVLHRTGAANYIDGNEILTSQTEGVNLGFGDRFDVAAGATGPQGAAGPVGPQGIPVLSRSPVPSILSPHMLKSAVDPAVLQQIKNGAVIVQTAEADVLRNAFAETAFWNAHVVTDASGQGSVEFTLPDSLTQWRVKARGVTKDTLAGEDDETFRASKPFWVELQSPPVLQGGDTTAVTAVVHNDSDAPVSTEVTLLTNFDGKESTQTATVKVAARASEEARFEFAVPDAREAKLRVAANAGAERDAEEKPVAIRALGIDLTDYASGLAQDDRAIDMALPDGEYSASTLKISVAPPSPNSLLDLIEKPQHFGWHGSLVASGVLRSLALENAARDAKTSGDSARYIRLAREIESGISRLSNSQNSDGGWSWALPRTNAFAPRVVNNNRNNNQNNNQNSNRPNDGRTSDTRITAEAALVLATAQSLGFDLPDDTLDRATSLLNTRFQASNDESDKALILYAQSVAGVADFAHVNRLYRLRNSLDVRGLSYVALTLLQMEREVMAKEVLEALLSRTSPETLRAAQNKSVELSPSALNVNDAEEVALAAFATAKVEASNALLKPLIELLWSKRQGEVWSTPRASAWALSALLQTSRAARLAPEKYTLAVKVNGQVAKRITVDSNAVASTLEVPIGSAPRAKVEFDLEGRGAYAYAVTLSGWTKTGLYTDEEIKPVKVSDNPEKWESKPLPSNGPLRVSRAYYSAPRTWNGKVVPAGFNVVRNASSWSNVANEVAVGERVRVQTYWAMDYNRREELKTVVLRESLPAGARVLEDSISGSFDRYEIGEREITFFFSNRYSEWIYYDLYGAQPGNYRVPPAKVWAFDKPQYYAFGTYKNFKVLPRGGKSSDDYRITPDEMYYLGKWSFDRASEALAKGETPLPEDVQMAEKYLTELFNRDADPKDWKLNDSYARDISRMLFSLALRREDNAATVRYFETLRERQPDLVIPFVEIVQTAKAYDGIGEHERAIQVLRATAEASFRRETGVAGTLVEENEHRASYEYLAERAQEYPDLANVQSALYTLAQSIGQRAEELGKNKEVDSGKAEESQELSRLAALTLRDFLALYPENPVADEASFQYAVNLVEQGKFTDAIAWTKRSQARYADSAFADDFDYIATYASFLAENYDAALSGAKRLATTEYSQPDGTKEISAYRPFALYIAAQIYHARGDVNAAMEYYREVADQFPDAHEAADFFDQKSLKMPEVSVVSETQPVQLKVTSRNVEKAQIAVYKVDLLQFYQERRNLLSLGQMNLSGIKPMWQGALEFTGAKYADREETIALPLPDKGAYFVTVQSVGGRPSVSGVVVRSSLDLEVQEDATSGRLRVNVAREDAKKGIENVVPKAEVWAVGSENGEFLKGTTDLRGLVAFDDVKGRATVIAFKDGEYAFYRGETVLQPQLVQTQSTPRADAAKPANANAGGEKKSGFKEEARNAYMSNQQEIQSRNAQQLQGAMQSGKGSAGVAVQAAY
jgi:uncharacterized protein YfaS (alpha-2-macroglobulin family)/TolA-binding protein